MPSSNGESFLYFPQAYLALENSDFQQVTDFTLNLTNNAKLVKTQRRGVAGAVRGKPETNCSFNSVVDEDGQEHNYPRLVQNGTVKKMRVKAPGGDTYVLTGIFQNWAFNSPLEDAVGVACTFIGKMSKQ